MSEEDFNSWTETVHLLCSPKNARRLLDSIAEAEVGKAPQDGQAHQQADRRHAPTRVQADRR
ncbi:hypothetical protein ALMP_16170 [Streptomyces sp. A012304]|nr:hypothetical protein ALMP_16170 [Streptomyces sp. A012304]